MAENFLQLSLQERTEALEVAATASGRPIYLLEKDVWVVWALSALFSAPFAEHLVFKGGTSLSKAYGVIKRFSEDIDLTYDIRTIASDLVANAPEALPKSHAEARRWSREIRTRLAKWVGETVLPFLQMQLSAQGLNARLRNEDEKLFIEYDVAAQGPTYVAPNVMLEFGARSTGEPADMRDVVCDAQEFVPGLTFPVARPRVMLAERTFWEKATAIHVYCLQSRTRGDRFSRHWHDIVRLDEAGIAKSAFADRTIASAVARHKSRFFAENAVDGSEIDYAAAVGAGLLLEPTGGSREALKEDYASMVDAGLLLSNAEPFDDLMNKCADIAARANAPAL